MWIFLAVLAVLLVATVYVYNRLVRLRLQAQNAWSDIDVQLKRRHDLVPNLVESVKGYAGHENRTLQSVTEARAGAVAARNAGPVERAQAEAALSAALRGLSVQVEAYPELRASANFLDLQQSLSRLEDAIQSARRYYNAVVRELNAAIFQFPSNLVARTFGFTPREFFEAEEAAREVPAVRFEAPPAAS